MIISSELTGKIYKTVDDCLKAEEEYRLQKEAEQKEKALDEAYHKAIDACDEFLTLAGLNIDVEESTDEEVFDELIDLFKKFFE